MTSPLYLVEQRVSKTRCESLPVGAERLARSHASGEREDMAIRSASRTEQRAAFVGVAGRAHALLADANICRSGERGPSSPASTTTKKPQPPTLSSCGRIRNCPCHRECVPLACRRRRSAAARRRADRIPATQAGKSATRRDRRYRRRRQRLDDQPLPDEPWSGPSAGQGHPAIGRAKSLDPMCGQILSGGGRRRRSRKMRATSRLRISKAIRLTTDCGRRPRRRRREVLRAVVKPLTRGWSRRDGYGVFVVRVLGRQQPDVGLASQKPPIDGELSIRLKTDGERCTRGASGRDAGLRR